MNAGAGEAPLILRAKPARKPGIGSAHPSTQRRSWKHPSPEKRRKSGSPSARIRIATSFTSATTGDARVQPVSRLHRVAPGMDKYLNVVREGSTVSDPSAFVLDTGEKLATRLITGAELAAAKITSEEPVKPTTQVVVISFLL